MKKYNMTLGPIKGMFLCQRRVSPMTDGLVSNVIATRIYYYDFTGQIRYITIDSFNTSVDNYGNKWYWVQENPTDTFWWPPAKVAEYRQLIK